MLLWGSISVALVGGITMVVADGAVMVIGALLLVAGAIGACFGIAVSAALSAYLESFLYRYAVGLPVPGVDLHLLPPRRPA